MAKRTIKMPEQKFININDIDYPLLFPAIELSLMIIENGKKISEYQKLYSADPTNAELPDKSVETFQNYKNFIEIALGPDIVKSVFGNVPIGLGNLLELYEVVAEQVTDIVQQETAEIAAKNADK